MPKGADPKAYIDVVPDSTNNFKGMLGVGQFKMLKKPKQQTPKQKPKQQTSFAKRLMSQVALYLGLPVAATGIWAWR